MQAVCCHEFDHVAQTAVFIEEGNLPLRPLSCGMWE